MSNAFRLVPRAVRCARRALGVVRERGSRIAVLSPWLVVGAGLLACGLSAHPGAARADSAEIGGINTVIVPSAPCAGESLAVQFSACVCASRFTSAGFDPSSGLKLVVATDP